MCIGSKRMVDELIFALRSSDTSVKLAAAQCFVSLLRSDKMHKSILMEQGEFHKDLIAMFVAADKDYEAQIVSCKALCNLALDFER
jgi:hypothetical protein